MKANMLQVTTPQSRLPELIAAAGERASMRFLEFFAANIRNPHTVRTRLPAGGGSLERTRLWIQV